MAITFAELGKSGRLGNAMFQAAATIALALRNNDTYQFPNSWQYKDDFNIPKENFVDNIQTSQTHQEINYNYYNILYSPNYNLSGYYQSYKHFESNVSDIKKLLTPNIKIDKQNYTAVHVRRTDYLTHKNCYNILTRQNYYDKAMIASGGSKFLLFGDDFTWIKQNFTGNEFDFSDGNINNPIVDLALMSNCIGGNIIANSSFSWWGAWLNDDGPKIYPRIWFGPELAKINDTKNLCPQNWIRI